MKFSPFHDQAVAQVVSCRQHYRVRGPIPGRSVWYIWWIKMALGEVSFRVVWFSTVIVIPHLLHTHIRLSAIGLIKS